MKNLALSFFFALIFIATAQSQSWRVAPMMGVNASAISYSSDFRDALNPDGLTTRTGPLAKFQIGAYLDYAFSDRFSVRSGLLYTGKGGSLSINYSYYGITGRFRGRYLFNYLDVPLLMSAALGNNGIRLVAGPILGLAINGKGTVNGNNYYSNYYNYGYLRSNTTNFKIGSSATDNMVLLDLGASLGIAKEIEVGRQPLELGLHIQPSFSKWTTVSSRQPDYFARHLLVGFRAAYFLEINR